MVRGKAPYHPVCTGPAADRYADRSLSGGTPKGSRRRSIVGKIDRRRSISTVGGRLKRNREGKKKKKKRRSEEEKVPRAVLAPARRRRPRAIFLPARGEENEA
ncbi:hypothetical protein BHM03_00032043, partial [Ensete ventricosum]